MQTRYRSFGIWCAQSTLKEIGHSPHPEMSQKDTLSVSPTTMNSMKPFDQALAQSFDELRGSWDRFREDPSSPKALHAWRIGVRKLESTLMLFSRFVPKALFKHTATALHRCLSRSNRLRNIDATLRWLHKNSDPPTDTDRLHHKRSKGFKRVLSQASEEMMQVTEDQAEWLHAMRQNARQGDMLAHAAMQLSDMTRQLVRRGERATSVYRLHKLRVCAKQLRYALEFLNRIGFEASTQKAIESLVEIQNELGDLQDQACRNSVLGITSTETENDFESFKDIQVWIEPRIVFIAKMSFWTSQVLTQSFVDDSFEGRGTTHLRDLQVSVDAPPSNAEKDSMDSSSLLAPRPQHG